MKTLVLLSSLLITTSLWAASPPAGDKNFEALQQEITQMQQQTQVQMKQLQANLEQEINSLNTQLQNQIKKLQSTQQQQLQQMQQQINKLGETKAGK